MLLPVEVEPADEIPDDEMELYVEAFADLFDDAVEAGDVGR